jgi:hypothetical protein
VYLKPDDDEEMKFEEGWHQAIVVHVTKGLLVSWLGFLPDWQRKSSQWPRRLYQKALTCVGRKDSSRLCLNWKVRRSVEEKVLGIKR